MNKFAKNILAKIKKEKIKPKEKWVFQTRNNLFWLLAILGIIFMGVFLGNVIHEFAAGEWDIAHRYPHGRADFFFHAIPFLWLLGIASAFAFAFFLFRKTKKGYKYGLLAISGVIFIVSAICGVALLSTPLPPKFREFRMQHFPPPFERQDWNNPGAGLLIGEILETGESLLILNSIDNARWEVDISEAKIPPILELKAEMKIRIIGEKISEGEFKAEFIKPETPFQRMQDEMDRERMGGEIFGERNLNFPRNN